jgi:CheY-like chemotaxis protein
MSHVPPSDTRDEAAHPGAGRVVLIVDDDPLNRKLAVLRLRAAGFAVQTANSAETALQIAAAAPPDAILSDIQMPGMDGFQLRQAVRADASLAGIPVILMSSALAEEWARRGVNDRQSTCVVRSPDLREAIEAIAAAFR